MNKSNKQNTYMFFCKATTGCSTGKLFFVVVYWKEKIKTIQPGFTFLNEFFRLSRHKAINGGERIFA